MINMNMQKLMMEAQKMQAKLQKEQVELENSIYEGTSSLVTVTMNGKKEVKSVKLNIDEDITKEDIEKILKEKELYYNNSYVDYFGDEVNFFEFRSQHNIHYTKFVLYY